MAGFTLATAQAQLDAHLAAQLAILNNQEYVIGSRRFKKADLAAVQAGIAYWNQVVQDLTPKLSGRGRAVVPSPSF